MYPASFHYARPGSVEEAVELLRSSQGEAKVLAGGHSLLPLMKLRLAEPASVVDIGRLRASLAYIREEGGQVRIGAMTTYHALEGSADLRQLAPIVAEAASLIGDVQVRNRGTIGGSLAHGDPGADLPAVMLALNAEIVARGPGGERTIPVGQFFVDMLTTALRTDELLVEIRVPSTRPGTGSAYQKYEQPASGYALVGIAAVISLSGDTIGEARIGVTGVASKPYRAGGVEAALSGNQATSEVISEAANHATEGVDVQGDLHAAPDYRAHLAQVLTRRAVHRAIERAR